MAALNSGYREIGLQASMSRVTLSTTVFGMFETCVSAVIDEFPKLLRKRRTLVIAVACFLEFILGLPLITQGGIYILQVIDWYCASFSLMLISLTECLAISWVYGLDRFYKDIELMIGYKPMRVWLYAWKFVTPVVIFSIWLFSVSTLGPVTYGDKPYPQWAIVFGWCLGLVSIVPIPANFVYQVYRSEGTLMERIRKLSKPLPSWGPSKEIHRQAYLESLSPSELGPLEYRMENGMIIKQRPTVPEASALLP